MTISKRYEVKWSRKRRFDGTKEEGTILVRAVSELEAEDYALKKVRLLGYRDFTVEASQL